MVSVEKYIRFCESSFGSGLMTKEADYLRTELEGRRKINALSVESVSLSAQNLVGF